MDNNLKLYRNKQGLTQAKLAKTVGISETHYQNIEYGKAEPGIYTAQRLANALNTTIPDLFPLPNEASPIQK